MPATIPAHPLVAHRYTAVREIEPGSTVILPAMGRFVVERVERDGNVATFTGHRAGIERTESVDVPLRSPDYMNRFAVEGEFTERELAQIEGYAEGLMSGLAFRNVAASHRSAIGYRPPSGTRSYAQALVALGKGATDDRQATLVAAAAKALTPHAHGPEATLAYVYEAVGKELARGWFDTIRNASPEPGRRSDNEHDYTLADRLRILVTLERAEAAYPMGSVPGVGWCADALARSLGIDTTVRS